MAIVNFKTSLKIDFKDVAELLGPWCKYQVDSDFDRITGVYDGKESPLFDLIKNEDGYHIAILSYSSAATLDEIISILPKEFRLPIVTALQGTGLEISGTVQKEARPSTVVTLRKSLDIDFNAVTQALAYEPVLHPEGSKNLRYSPLKPWKNSCHIVNQDEGKIILYLGGKTEKGWAKFGSDYSAEELDKIISALPSALLRPITQSIQGTQSCH